MSKALTFQTKVHFRRGRSGRKHLHAGKSSTEQADASRVPRVSRLMALAIRFDGLIRHGVIADQAELARLGHVSRARITQVMNLLLLAPIIQEDLLFLPRVERGRCPIHLRQLQPIAQTPDWREQRQLWAKLCKLSSKP